MFMPEILKCSVQFKKGLMGGAELNEVLYEQPALFLLLFFCVCFFCVFFFFFQSKLEKTRNWLGHLG